MILYNIFVYLPCGYYMKVGIIGGTGFYDLCDSQEILVHTDYGDIPIAHILQGTRDIFFLSRHGKTHEIPPHKVNYWGNVQALKKCKVDCVLALCTVGSMRNHISPGHIFIPTDFIDFTRRRTTFYDTEVVHIDMTIPFCPHLQEALRCALEQSRLPFSEGIYVATEGPRLETKAEIAMFSQLGDVVGMTLVPEVTLARELGLCYAAVCLVSNMCTGFQGSLPANEIADIYRAQKPIMQQLIFMTVANIQEKKKCSCGESLKNSRL